MEWWNGEIMEYWASKTEIILILTSDLKKCILK
jgi:hypothetical protein